VVGFGYQAIHQAADKPKAIIQAFYSDPDPVVSKNSNRKRLPGAQASTAGVQSSSWITGSSQKSTSTEWKRYSNQRLKASKPSEELGSEAAVRDS
jgi:hypothetical protein